MSIWNDLETLVELPNLYFLGSSSCKMLFSDFTNAVDLRIVSINDCIVSHVIKDCLVLLNWLLRFSLLRAKATEER